MTKTTFWYHPESESFYIMDHDPQGDQGDGQSVELTEYEWIKRRIEQIDNDPNHTLPEGVDAVIKGGYIFPAGGFHGSIFYDRHGRFENGHQVKLSRVVEKLPGGIYKTQNSTYLVEMIDPESTNG